MPSSRASSDNRKSNMIVSIIFAFLFLVSSVLAVVMYMKISQEEKKADEATQKLNKLATSTEQKALESMAAGSKTAIGQATDDMRHLAVLVGGPDMADLDLSGIRGAVDRRVEPIWSQLGTVLSDPQQINPEAGLVQTMQALMTETLMWSSRFIDAEMALDDLKKNREEALNNKDATLSELKVDLDLASNAAKTNKEGYDQLLQKQMADYERVISELKEQYAQAEQLQKESQNKTMGLESELTEAGNQIKELKHLLQQYRPSPEMETAALEPDGFVVSVVPRDNLAYINLAKNDHIYRGLTFSVYDSYLQMPKSGQGKGTLEVIEIMDTISKCRITKYDPTNPIMEHDIIANLVWDTNKKYNFCVAGDFDFNKDGKITEEDRSSVVKLIEGWGGQVSPTLSVGTDFLVLGEPPFLPQRPADEFDEASAAAVRAYRQALQQRDRYDQIRQNSAALGVPTFNLSRFLYFIGFY